MNDTKETKLKPEIVFVICSLLFGVMLIALTPPIQTADEQYHFSRAYSVAHGQIISKKLGTMMGNHAPAAFNGFVGKFAYLCTDLQARTSFSAIRESAKIKILKNESFFCHQSNMALYSPAAYLPQAAGIALAGLFTASVLKLLIAAKLFLLFFYTAAGYFTLKSMPFLKWAVLLLLLTPMSLSMGASVSADGVLIGVSALYFAKIFQYACEEAPLSKKRFFFLMFLAIFLALVKQGALITLFAFFIPKEKFSAIFKTEKLKSPVLNMFLLLLPAFSASFIWSKLTAGTYVPIHDANPQLQTAFIMQHPVIYLQSLISTFKMYYLLIIYSSVGILGWLNVIFPSYVYWSYIAVLFLNIIFSPAAEKQHKSTVFQLIWLMGLILINIFAICTIIYITWIPPYTTDAWEGLQGRYFIPLLPPLFAFLFLLLCNYFKPQKSGLILPVNALLLVNTYINVAVFLFLRYF